MSETWAPASSTSETWTATTAGAGRSMFSPLIFSRVYHTDGKAMFSFRSSDGNSEGWGSTPSTAETWTSA